MNKEEIINNNKEVYNNSKKVFDNILVKWDKVKRLYYIMDNTETRIKYPYSRFIIAVDNAELERKDENYFLMEEVFKD